MGIVREHPPVKYFAGVLFQRHLDRNDFEKYIRDKIGEIESSSELFGFLHTQYYEKEMGPDLLKYYIVFKDLQSPLMLPDIKLLTNEIEDYFADPEGKRRINIDPGYVSEAKVVLATTKNFDHRVYVGKGIYADIQLRLRIKAFRENEWTYPDYRLPWVKEMFLDLRNEYFRKLVNP